MKPIQPFQVIYQTAEDGLGDTVKPRLIEAAADLDRVLVIDEAKRELTLSDERIEKVMLSRLVDTFFSRTSWTMLLYAENHSISVA